MSPSLLKSQRFWQNQLTKLLCSYDALCTYFHIPSLPRQLDARPLRLFGPPTVWQVKFTLNFWAHMISVSHGFLTPDLRSMINAMIFGHPSRTPTQGRGIDDIQTSIVICYGILLFNLDTRGRRVYKSRFSADALNGCPLNHCSKCSGLTTRCVLLIVRLSRFLKGPYQKLSLDGFQERG